MGRMLVATLCVTAFAATFSIGAFPALLPDIGAAARLADWQLGVLAGVFGFARMMVDIPVGLLVARHLRLALALAPVALAAGVLSLAAADHFATLVLGRVLMGVAHAIGMIAGITAILRYSAGWRLGSALNAYELSAMLGVLGGVTVLGALPPALPWNVAWLGACAPQLLGLLVLPLLLRALPPAPAPSAAAPASRSVADRPGKADRMTPLAVLAFVAGGTVAVAYSMVELYLVPIRGNRDFGLDRTGVARLLMVAQVADIVALIPAGILADRRGATGVVGCVLLLMAVAIGLVTWGALPLMVVGCGLFGLAMAGWMLPLAVLRGETPPELVAWRTALYRVCVDGGMFLGPFASGLLGADRQGVLPAVVSVVLVFTGVQLFRARRL